jgi:hypothetical protein
MLVWYLAAEMTGHYLKGRRVRPAIALSVDTSIPTAIANDYVYAKVFAHPPRTTESALQRFGRRLAAWPIRAACTRAPDGAPLRPAESAIRTRVGVAIPSPAQRPDVKL